MQSLILQPTSLAQWQVLVHEAAQVRDVKFSEELESYLIFLLQRFMVKPGITNSAIALDYLQSFMVSESKRCEQLQEAGDKCLLFSGLFPEYAVRRNVTITYFVEMGRQAYYVVSVLLSEQAPLFTALTQQFVVLMDILHCMRELAGMQNSLSPLQAEELWRTTRSEHSLKVLRRYTQGFVVEKKEEMEIIKLPH